MISSALIIALTAITIIPMSCLFLPVWVQNKQFFTKNSTHFEPLKYFKFRYALLNGTIGIILALSWFVFLSQAISSHFHTIAHSRYLFTMNEVLWLFPALLLSYMAVHPVTVAIKHIMQDKSILQSSYPGKKEILLTGTACWVAFVCIVIAINHYASFTDQEILIHSFDQLSISKQPYSNVASIQFSGMSKPEDKTYGQKFHYTLRFKDGSVWATSFGGRRVSGLEDMEFAKFVSQKSKVNIETRGLSQLESLPP